jgi:hypothetical protein
MRAAPLVLAVFCRAATGAVIFLSCLGCNRPPNRVHFVVPDGFLGSFAIQPNDPEGIEPSRSAGHYVLNIPETRVIKIKGYYPFSGYLYTASYANGQPIWVEKRWDDKPAPGEIAMWGGGSSSWHEGGRLISQIYWFVGTNKQWKEANVHP